MGMWTRSEFFAGPGKGKYYPEQLHIRCWNAWDENGEKTKCCMTNDWQTAPRIWEHGHVESFRLAEDFMPNDIHPEQGPDTVAKPILHNGKAMKPEHANILTEADIERRVTARLAKDAEKLTRKDSRLNSRSRSPHGKASDDECSSSSEVEKPRRAPTICAVSMPMAPPQGLKRGVSADKLGKSPAAKSVKASPSKAGSAIGAGDNATAPSVGAALVTHDQFSVKWTGQMEQVSHSRALMGVAFGQGA